MNRNKRISELSVSEFAGLTKDIIDYAIQSLGELGKSLIEYHIVTKSKVHLSNAIGKEYSTPNWEDLDSIKCKTQTIDEIKIGEQLDARRKENP